MTAIATKRILRSELVNNVLGEGDDWAKVGRGRILEPGVVTYDNDDGTKTTYLLTREAIARGRATAAGKPIVGRSGGFDHLKVKAADAAQGKYDGDAIEAYAGEGDHAGWECLHFLVRDQATKEACRNGYEFSCGYIPTDVDETPGKWHNVPYDAVINDLEYTHFAVVPEPRYKDATIELMNSMDGGIVKNTLKGLLKALVGTKDLREIVNSLDEDEKKEKAEAEKKNAEEKAGKKKAAEEAFNSAMAAAKTDEEKAAAKAKFEKDNADIDAGSATDPMAATPGAPKADLPPQPLGGGDVAVDPSIPGNLEATPGAAKPAENAGETPEQAQEREKKAAEAAALKNAEDAKKADEDKKRLEADNAASAELSRAWDVHGEDMIDVGGMGDKATVDVSSGKLHPLHKQPAEVQAWWKSSYEDAHENKAERMNSIGKKAKARRELKNAAEKKKQEAAVKAEALRVERFNSLRRAAEERGGGGDIGVATIGIVSTTEKEDLGRARYGSGQ